MGDDGVQRRKRCRRSAGGEQATPGEARGFWARIAHSLKLNHKLVMSRNEVGSTPRGAGPHSYNRCVLSNGEYEAATTGAVGVLRPASGFIALEGPDVLEFLQGQVTNDVEALEPGTGCYAALLDHKGKLRADMRILRREDSVLVETAAIARTVLTHMIGTYSLGRDMRWRDVSDEHRTVSLLGPEALPALDPAPPAEEHAFVEGAHGLHVATDLGADVICPAGKAEEVLAALALPRASEALAECLRIESGRPRLGYDMDGDTIPQEAGVNERAVNFEKGCYVGQETVARLHWKGRPNRHLRGLRLSGAVERGTELRLGDKVVGKVGSVCASPVHGPIALALVRREAEPGDTLSAGDGAATAKVVELPFAPGRDQR